MCLNLHCVVQIKNRIDLAVDCDIQLRRIGGLNQSLENDWIEKMVAHREDKRRFHAFCRGQKRDSVLLLPLGIFDYAKLTARWNQSNNSGTETLAFKS